MKVIELLNKIANGEKLPEKIKYENIIWKLNNINDTYDNGEQCFFEDYIEKKYVITDILNEEVEVIKENKKIEKLEYIENGDFIEVPSNQELMSKINEIIDKINSMED